MICAISAVSILILTAGCSTGGGGDLRSPDAEMNGNGDLVKPSSPETGKNGDPRVTLEMNAHGDLEEVETPAADVKDAPVPKVTNPQSFGKPTQLGQYLLADKGMLAGPRASVRVYAEQAETGDVESMTRLAVCYYLGSGTQVQHGLARKWFTRSAEENDKKAQFALGFMLEHAEGGDANPHEALKMYMKSAEGHGRYSELAQAEVDRLSKSLAPSEVALAKKEVIDWFNKSMLRKTKLEKTRRPY
jgi:hypothetical protein